MLALERHPSCFVVTRANEGRIPKHGQICTFVTPPANSKSLGARDCRSDENMAPFDLDACIEQLLGKQLLHEALLREICAKTKEVLMRESNVVHVSAPVTVVGDIHG
jgi:hypothetical protein